MTGFRGCTKKVHVQNWTYCPLMQVGALRKPEAQRSRNTEAGAFAARLPMWSPAEPCHKAKVMNRPGRRLTTVPTPPAVFSLGAVGFPARKVIS